MKALRARPKIDPIEISELGGIKSAGPCVSTATQIRYEYEKLVPQVHRARAMIRSGQGGIAITNLGSAFQGTTLGKWCDNDEWKTLIEEYSKPKGRVAYAKEHARAIIRRKTGLTDETIKTYLKRAAPSPRTTKHFQRKKG